MGSEQHRGPQAASATGEARGRVRRGFIQPWGAAEDLPAEEDVAATRVDEGLVEGAADQLMVVQLRYDASKNRHGRSSGNKGNDSSEGHAEPDRMWPLVQAEGAPVPVAG